MRYRFMELILILACTVLFCVQPAISSAEEEEGFKTIFNGKDLEGWKIQGMEKAGPKILEDGVMSVSGWDYWAVFTKDEYKNFILRFDVKFDKKGNSGILIHTAAKEIYKSAFEIQLNADTEEDKPEKRTGSIFGKVPPLKDAVKPIGEWNAVEIKYQAPQLWVAINGETVQDGVDISKIEGLKHKFEKGRIAIQRNDLKKAVYFKNIRIKVLPE